MKAGEDMQIIALFPLLRQMCFVMVPALAMPVFSSSSLGISYLEMDQGVSIMTVANYTMYLVFSAWKMTPELKGWSASLRLPAMGVASLLVVIWWFFRFSAPNGWIGDELAGGSITRIWGATGLTLMAGASLWEFQRRDHRLRAFVCLSIVVASMQLLSTGSRASVLQPLVILVLAWVVFTRARPSVTGVAVSVLLSLLVGTAVFSMLAGLRSEFYFKGPKPELTDVLRSAKDVELSAGAALNLFTRLSAACASTDFIASQPELFPEWGADHIAGAATDVLISKRLFDLSTVVGFDHTMGGRGPGAYLDLLNGGTGEGYLAFPPEAEFYLCGGWFGVLVGSVLLAAVGRVWLSVFRKVFVAPLFTKAMLTGVLLPGFFYMEDIQVVLSHLMWNCIVLTAILVIADRLCARLPNLDVLTASQRFSESLRKQQRAWTLGPALGAPRTHGDGVMGGRGKM